MRLLLFILMAMTACADVCYDVSMHLYVPRVYDNSGSLGYRKYQSQRLLGRLSVSTDGSAVMSLTNITHKVGGCPVTYDVIVDDALMALVGSNARNVFKTSSVTLRITALPSYIPAYRPTDDETLELTLAGRGSSSKRVSGYAAGTLGCGCSWYGHMSPTRNMLDWSVVDRAAVYGTFKLKLKALTRPRR